MSNWSIQVGNAEIVALSDMSFPFPMPLKELWPKVPPDAWRPYRESYPDTFEDDKMRIEIGCYLVRSQGHTILIDTGYGPGPIKSIGGLRGQLMVDLADKGVRPEHVDTVFLSHLHSDHVGWNTSVDRGKLVATFPNARYIVHQADLEHFREPRVQAAASFPFMDKSIESLVRLGILDVIAQDTNLTDEVKAIHTPGHTPGHMSILISSQGYSALIEGDVLIHPAQVAEDDWNCHFDYDWPLATETRKKILSKVEADATMIVACHFPAPGFGVVARLQGRRYWHVGLKG